MLNFFRLLLKFFFPEKPAPAPIPVPEPAPKPVEPTPPAPVFTAREMLYNYAFTFLGKDASPDDVASDEYGCAETICNIIDGCFGDFPIEGGTIISTTVLYKKLKAHPKFEMVENYQQGDIIISPTGFGNGRLKNGHVGIVASVGAIMSNDSFSGLFMLNYTIDTWVARYRNIGGFPLYFFRRTAP